MVPGDYDDADVDRVSDKWVNGELEIIFKLSIIAELRPYPDILVQGLRKDTKNLPSGETMSGTAFRRGSDNFA